MTLWCVTFNQPTNGATPFELGGGADICRNANGRPEFTDGHQRASVDGRRGKP